MQSISPLIWVYAAIGIYCFFFAIKALISPWQYNYRREAIRWAKTGLAAWGIAITFAWMFN